MENGGDEQNVFFKNFSETISSNQKIIGVLVFGIFLTVVGVLIFGKNIFSKNEKLEEVSQKISEEKLVVEIAGAVVSPGVYRLEGKARVEDLINASGGFSDSADRDWVEKYINRAALLSDGQKLYILKIGEKNEDLVKQTEGVSASVDGVYQNISANISGQGSGFISINLATQKELESLNGIGPVYAQKIIEQRPYSNIEEIVTKANIPQKTYDKIKNELSL